MHRDEGQSGVRPQQDHPSVDVEAKEARRVALVETGEEPAIRGVMVPTLADEAGADEGGREAGAEEDLDEEVVVVEHF